jgi:predicted ArsR family transcriptional regulator
LTALSDVRPFLAEMDHDSVTAQELAETFQLGRTAVKERIRQLLKDGRITRSQKWQKDSTGRIQRVSAYKLVKGPVTNG